MGIPSYFSFIVKNHGNIIKMLHCLKDVNNFYLDSNSIVYDCLRALSGEYKKEFKIEFENKLIKAICVKIDTYIQVVKPSDTVFIAFDGVAPVAKLEQQRNRRYKSQLMGLLKKELAESDEISEEWDKTAITPGTLFMKKMGDYITNFYKNREKHAGVNKIIVSTASEVGEGEHKLFAYIRKYPKKHKNQTTLVYGLDADLIMLCLNHLPISKQIYLFRETPEFIKSIDASLKPNEAYYLDIPQLAGAITSEMNNYKKINSKQQVNRLYDYIFLCFFMGNDFMPHFPSLNIRTGAIHIIIAAYQNTIGKTNKNLTDGKCIYWANVRILVEYLANAEHRNLLGQYKIRDKWEKRYHPNKTLTEKMDKFDKIPTKKRDLEKFINPHEKYWQMRYYKALFDTEISKDYLKKISINYLEGLEWVMKYYTTGCADWRWSYHYYYPPLLKDLLYFIPNWETCMIPKNSHKAVKPLVQLAYVLPRPSLNLLPPNIKAKILKEFPDHYRMDFKIYWAFCKYFWEGHVDLPYINLNLLEELIN